MIQFVTDTKESPLVAVEQIFNSAYLFKISGANTPRIPVECRNPHVGLRPKFFRNFLSEFSHFWRAQRSDRGAGHIRKKRMAESIVFVGTRKKIPESLLRTSDRCLGAKPGEGRGRCRRVFGTRWRFGAAASPQLLRKVRLCFGSGGQLVQIFFLRCTRARIEGRKLPLLAID